MKILSVTTLFQNEFIDITHDVQQIVTACGAINNGWCMVFAPHTTAGVTINENADPDVPSDILQQLDKMAPQKAGYRHQEGNSAAHIKSLLTGSSVMVAIQNNRLVLGKWQGVFFCEYDGPRKRDVHVHVYRAAE